MQLHCQGVGHGGTARGVIAGVTGERMLVDTEHKAIPLAQLTAQVMQGAFDH